MVLAFQIILTVIMTISFMGVIVDSETKQAKLNFTAVCIAAMISFVITLVLL